MYFLPKSRALMDHAPGPIIAKVPAKTISMSDIQMLGAAYQLADAAKWSSVVRASQADIAFQRQFRLTEKMQLRFRGEFFNIFNHPNFGPPDNNITDALFGYSTATLASSLGSGGANGGLNPLYQVGGPRSTQLALKLQF
jgi:hypothetical protein